MEIRGDPQLLEKYELCQTSEKSEETIQRTKGWSASPLFLGKPESPLETSFCTNRGKISNWDQSAWTTKAESCPSSLNTSYDEILGPINSGRKVDFIYLDFRKVFDTVSERIIVPKLGHYCLEGWTKKFVKTYSCMVRLRDHWLMSY